MADYTQTPQRPNITPTQMLDAPPRQPVPAPTGWGMVPALGAVAVVGIVALVAWGVMNNAPAPDVAPVAVQPVPEPAAPAVVPDAAAAPEPMVQPEAVPQEVPVPTPEVAPAPTPAPAPAPSN